MVEQLTEEQRATIRELQDELRELDLKADIEWAKYIHTGDEACFEEVLALESEREMKGLIAYIPKAGELKVSKVRKLVTKVKNLGGEECKDCELDEKNEVRLGALESVNEWRSNYDLPPLPRLPRGVPEDASECTLAQAFKVSLKELGVTIDEIEVSDASMIRLSGTMNGESWSDSPVLDESASQLISNFDEEAYLDLIEDESLRYMAERLVEDYYMCDEDIGRLQEVSDELAIRGLQHDVSYQGSTITIGKDSEPMATLFETSDED